MKNVVEFPQAIETAMKEYMVLSSAIKSLEEKQKIFREFIVAEAAKQGVTKLDAGEFTASIAEASRENFNLKVAREFLGEALQPYITVSNYTRLTVKRGVRE